MKVVDQLPIDEKVQDGDEPVMSSREGGLKCR